MKSNNLKTYRQSKDQTIQRLKDKISSYKMELKMYEKFHNHMNDALNYAQEDKSVLCNDIESIDNVIVTPSFCKIIEKKQGQGICVGDCIVMYEKQLLICKWQGKNGELMCNKMKLQEDILFNVSSSKMVGFTEDFICRKKIIKNMLDKDRLKDSVNWQSVSTNGVIYPRTVMHLIVNSGPTQVQSRSHPF